MLCGVCWYYYYLLYVVSNVFLANEFGINFHYNITIIKNCIIELLKFKLGYLCEWNANIKVLFEFNLHFLSYFLNWKLGHVLNLRYYFSLFESVKIIFLKEQVGLQKE
jgi:hypothetical protein